MQALMINFTRLYSFTASGVTGVHIVPEQTKKLPPPISQFFFYIRNESMTVSVLATTCNKNAFEDRGFIVLNELNF